MGYLVLMFVHVGSLFVATALAIGPSVMFVLIARSEDRDAIRRAFAYAGPVFRIGGVAYGLGILFGLVTALSGGIPLTTSWLLDAYVLVVLLIATNFVFERWTRRVARAASDDGSGLPDLRSVLYDRTAMLALAGMVGFTLAIVFVMVVKPAIPG
jgi:hypothetical protein